MSNSPTFDPQFRAEAESRGGQSGWGSATGGVGAHDRSEGTIARVLEQQTSRLPSDTWLWAAGGSIALSLYLQATEQRQRALFVGQWAPTFLLLGIYNKMVKQHGSE